MGRDIKFEYGFTNHAPVKLSIREIENLIFFDHDMGDIKYRRQFTGLTDKNNNPVFEGDIVSVSGINTEIKYSETDFSFILWVEDYGQFMGLPYLVGLKDFEVVGNIYEDSNLIDKG